MIKGYIHIFTWRVNSENCAQNTALRLLIVIFNQSDPCTVTECLFIIIPDPYCHRSLTPVECPKLVLLSWMTFRVVLKLNKSFGHIFQIQIGVLIHVRFFHCISNSLFTNYNSRLAAVSILQWDASWHTEWSPLLWLVALINEISTSQRHQHNISDSSWHELLWHEACHSCCSERSGTGRVNTC